MLNTRIGCYLCFKTLNPEDEKSYLRTFVGCNQCKKIYHETCWMEIKKCLNCRMTQVHSKEIPPLLPLQSTVRHQIIPIKPTKICEIDKPPSPNPPTRGCVISTIIGITVILFMLWFSTNFVDGKATVTVQTISTPTSTKTIPKPTSTPKPKPTNTPRPTKSPTPKPTSTPNYKPAIKEVVYKYGEVKVDNTTYLDSSQLDEVLINPALERQKRSACWLRNEGLFYEYDNRRVSIESITFDSNRYATVLTQIGESRVLRYQNGTTKTDYGYETYRAIYRLQRFGRDWYIYCFQALEDDDPATCEIELTGPDPC